MKKIFISISLIPNKEISDQVLEINSNVSKKFQIKKYKKNE